MEKTDIVFNQKIEARVIIRASTDGSVKIVEDANNNYVVLNDGVVVGIYRRQLDAVTEFGRLTRK